MKNTKLFLFCFLHVFTTIASEELLHSRDIPLEFEDYHTTRWPQFLVDFYHNIKETYYELKENLTHLPESIYLAFVGQHLHFEDQAKIRYTTSDDIGPEEKAFVVQRLAHAKPFLEKFLNVRLESNAVPKIGFLFSGGGFRAMISTLGFLAGAESIGLLDTAVYCTGLSGSTWALAPWIVSKKSINEFSNHLLQKLTHGIDHIDDPYELSELLEIFITKILCKQVVSTMDIYGGVLANTLLKNCVKKPMLVKLTETHAHIQKGQMPLPIYTAIQSSCDPYEWMEFTPFESGSSYLRSYIPTWAYGRKFKYGLSMDQSPEQTLGYFMGIFGSAFEVNLKDIVRMSATNLSYYGHQLPTILGKILKKCLQLILSTFIGQMRLFPSMLHNFTYQYKHSPIKWERTIALVDAGIDFNLPFPPLLRPSRGVDVIIVYDASASVSDAPELRKAVRYAQRKGLKFPAIDFDTVDQNHVSVFKDETDPEVPVIIYFPRIKNPHFSEEFDPDHCIENSFCNTFNFNYTSEQAHLLKGFAEFSIKQHEHIVRETLIDVLKTKYNYATDEPNEQAQEIVDAMEHHHHNNATISAIENVA